MPGFLTVATAEPDVRRAAACEPGRDGEISSGIAAILSLPLPARVRNHGVACRFEDPAARMTVELLIQAIVRQTTILIAQLATAGGTRAPLAHVAHQVFLD